MFSTLDSSSALLYGLSWSQKEASRAYSALIFALMLGEISSDDFFSLSRDLDSVGVRRMNKLSLMVDAKTICAKVALNHMDAQCSEIGDFERDVQDLTKKYRSALAQKVSVEHNFLSLIGDSWETRKFLLKLLALSQNVNQWNLGDCWGLIIEFGFTFETDATKAEELLFHLQEAVSEGHNWDGGMIGQALGFERIGSVLTFSVGQNDLASCDVHDFLGALLELLVRYEDATQEIAAEE